MSCMPTGRPPAEPQGIESAGRPVGFTGTVRITVLSSDATDHPTGVMDTFDASKDNLTVTEQHRGGVVVVTTDAENVRRVRDGVRVRNFSNKSKCNHSRI